MPTRPATEEMLIMDPLPARRIAGSACLVPQKTPVILTAMIWSRSSSVVSSMRLRIEMPALFTKICQ